MSSAPKDSLFNLVKSLSKAEKRSFRLYVNRFSRPEDSKYVQLFDLLDKLGTYEEGEVLSRLPEVKKQHLPNLKRHLYQQILTSLRLIHINKNIDIQIREQIDFARILYGKGLYMQALKILDRSKHTALDHHQDILHLEILEFEKMIEARHITRSRTVEHKMEELLEASRRRSLVSYTSSLYSNLNIQIQGWYILYGHARTAADRQRIHAFFEECLPPKPDDHRLSFFEKVNLYQARMWYQYIQLDLPVALEESRNWVRLLEQNDPICTKDPDLYVRSLYYQLLFHFLLGETTAYQPALDRLRGFIADHGAGFNPNSEMLSGMYLLLAELNHYYLRGAFREGLGTIDRVHRLIDRFGPFLDDHRVLLMYYKLACLHFGCGEFETAIDYLNRILLLRSGFLREELHYFAGLLHLLCLVELGQYDRIEHHLAQVKRILKKGVDLSEQQGNFLQALGKAMRLPAARVRDHFSAFRTQARLMQHDPRLKKEIAYLDLPAWVESFSRGMTLEAFLGEQNADRDEN